MVTLFPVVVMSNVYSRFVDSLCQCFYSFSLCFFILRYALPHTHTNAYTHISGDLVTMASQRRLTAYYSGARNLTHRWHATGEYVSLTPIKLDPFEPIASNLPFSSPNHCQSKAAHLFILKPAYL